MDAFEKLKILAEGAKYDVSCSSSGSSRGAQKGGTGLASQGGICHSFTPDGRCISLLKVLMTNNCIYNCRYCVNRRDADVPRARFTPEELCEIVLAFYLRNYIEGLFLSSAVFRTPDETMLLLIRTVRLLRKKHKFNGYIHLKAIPGCSPELVDEAAALVDRMSVNVELPSQSGLKMLAPQKHTDAILSPMSRLSDLYLAQKSGDLQKGSVVPAGQTTQMIVGATPDTDGRILRLSERFYRRMSMRRVYYSAYIPAGDESVLPTTPPNLIRENRLYQADWLLRFYGFRADELLEPETNLALDTDPKTSWALRHLDQFPVEIMTCPYEHLLRVPGIGVTSANRIVAARRSTMLTYDDLVRMRVTVKRAAEFVTVNGKYYGGGLDSASLRRRLITPQFADRNAEQMTLFDSTPEALTPAEYHTAIVLPAQSLMPSVFRGDI